MASLKPKYIQMAKTGTDRKLIDQDGILKRSFFDFLYNFLTPRKKSPKYPIAMQFFSNALFII